MLKETDLKMVGLQNLTDYVQSELTTLIINEEQGQNYFDQACACWREGERDSAVSCLAYGSLMLDNLSLIALANLLMDSDYKYLNYKLAAILWRKSNGDQVKIATDLRAKLEAR